AGGDVARAERTAGPPTLGGRPPDRTTGSDDRSLRPRASGRARGPGRRPPPSGANRLDEADGTRPTPRDGEDPSHRDRQRGRDAARGAAHRAPGGGSPWAVDTARVGRPPR